MTKLDIESSTLRIKVHFFHFFLKSFLWNTVIPRLFQQSCLVFSNFHCIAILIWGQLYYIANDDHDDFSLAVKRISQFFLMNDWFNHTINDTATASIVFAVTTCYFIVLLVCCGIIVKRFLNQENSTKGENRVIVMLGQVHITIVFWFLHVVLMNYISSGLLNIEVYELNAYQWILSIVYFIFIVLNYLFGFLFATFSYDPFKTANILSTHTPSFQIVTFCLKAALAPIITTNDNTTSQSWPFVIASLIFLAGREYLLQTRFPYYDYSAMKTASVLSSVSVIISLISFIALIVKSSTTVNPTILAYAVLIVIPLVVKISTSQLESTIKRYLVIEHKSLKSKCQVLKKLFSVSCIMRKSNFNMNTKLHKNLDELEFLGALCYYNRIIENNHNENLSQFEGIIISDTKETGAVLTQISKYYTSIGQEILKKTLRDGVDMFKHDRQLKVLFGYLALKNNFPMVVVSLCIMDSEKSSGLTKLTSMLLSQKLQERIDSFFYENTGKLLNLRSYMEKEYATNILLEEIKSAGKMYIAFWTKYATPHLKIKEFYDKSKEMEAKAERITEIWDTYAEKNKQFSQGFCNIYSLYLSILRASPHQSDRILQKFMVPESDVKEDHANKALIDDHLTESNVVALYASMTRESPGIIYRTSANLTDLLGWKKDDVIGEHVERMLPAFQRAPHFQVLLDHVASVFQGGKDSRMYRTIGGFILHKAGYIVPCDVYISVHPYVQEKPMYVVIVRVNKAHKDYLMITRTGVLEVYSKRFGERMGLNYTKKVNMSSICENYSDLEQAVEECTEDNKNEFMLNIFENSQKGPNKLRTYIANVTPRHMGRQGFYLVSLEPNGLKEEAQAHNHHHHHNHNELSPIDSRDETGNSDLDVSDEKQKAVVNDVGLLPLFSTSFHKTIVRTQTHKFSTPTPTLLIHDSEGTLVGSNTHHEHHDLTPLYNRNHEKKRTTFSDLPKAGLAHIGENHEGENDGKNVLQAKLSDPHHPLNSTLAPEQRELVSPLGSPGNVWQEILSPLHSTKQLIAGKSDLSEDAKGPVTRKKGVKQIQLEIMESSSVDTASKNYTAKLEQAVNVIPKNEQVQKLQIAFIVFLFISAIPLIVFHFVSNNTLDLVGSSIEVMSKSVFRIVRITDLGQYVRNVWQAEIGLYEPNRYAYLGWSIDAADQFLNQLPTILTDLNAKNNDLREYLYRLDTNLANQLYSDQLPVYEVANDGSIVETRKANTFDLITELVVQGNQFLTSGLPIDGNNPHLLFCLNNSFNDVLVAGEKTIPLLLEDNRTKLNHQSVYVYASMACLGVVGLLVMVFFSYIQKQFVKNRRHFINIFTLLDEAGLQKHLVQVQKLITVLEKSNADNKRMLHRATTENFQGLPSAKGKELKRSKKSFDTRGVDRILVSLAIQSALFLLLTFSAYPALLIYINSSSNSIITKMQLMSQSNLNLYNTNTLLATIYEYVQEGASTYFRGQPIAQEWTNTYQAMTLVQDFLLLEILGSDSGLTSNPLLEEMVTGNLCEAVPTTNAALAQLCPTMGGGAVEKGIVGLNSYTLAALKAVKDEYDVSAMTWNDKVTALSYQGLTDIEVFYPFTYNAYIWIDALIRTAISENLDHAKTYVIAIVLCYLGVYVVVGGLMCHKITRTLTDEMCHWRKMMKHIPQAVILDNKLLKSYIAKTSNGLFKSKE